MNNEQTISRINEAGNQVLRIGNLWNQANNYAIQGNFPRCNAIMERIWSELSGDATSDQIKEREEIEKKLKALKINLSLSDFTKKQKHLILKLRDLQYKALMEKDFFLRNLQNSQGKGTLYKDEFEDDFE